MIRNKLKSNLPRTDKNFIRDGRSPIPKTQVTSRVMSANKAKNTKPEMVFRKALWAKNIKGYRLHLKNVPGKPDIVFPIIKLAIFINGCFWHRCPICKLPTPKSNSVFWNDKFERNVQRDKMKIKLLKQANWKVVVVWECEIKRSLDRHVKKLSALVKNK